MTPAGRAQTAIEILDAVLAGAPAERELTRWARGSRHAGSKDRAAVRDIVFDCLRQRRSFGWLGGGESGRLLVLGMCLADGTDPALLFTGGTFAPPVLTDAERAAMGRPLDGAADAVRLDVPDHLEEPLRQSLGDRFEQVLAAMRQRAPIDLRANRLRATPQQAADALAREGIATMPVDAVPGALRVSGDGRQVRMSRAFQDGLVELQDVSSQAVAAMAGARPGMVVLDYCAGGGGKTLALAAAMQGRGELYAYDINAARMNDIPERADRAGARITVLDGRAMARLTGACDLVLVDAPCSGTGSWRRNPDVKWRLAPKDIEVLHLSQAAILDRALRFVRPGGRLVYATCSLLASENEAQVAALLRGQPGLRLLREDRLLPPALGDGFYFAEFSVC
jgi:16S rRNA (cytosine967-C5)-methyltransferase